MTDYRKFFDKELLGSWDIPDGRDEVILTIQECSGGELTGTGGRKQRKPVLRFKGTDKRMAVNATNGKALATMYGVHVEKWAGKRITVYKTQTQMGGDTVDCLRIRPVPPAPKNATEDAATE